MAIVRALLVFLFLIVYVAALSVEALGDLMSYIGTALKWVADNRTKVIGYIGAVSAQLGVSGLVGQRNALWCAFISSVITLGIGHFNDYKAKQAQE